MTVVAYRPTRDANEYTVHRVTDGDPATTGREWFVDLKHLAQHGDCVLDTDTDGPTIALLEEHDGWERVDAGGRARTLPDDFDDMNRAQLLSTREGNAIKNERTGKGDKGPLVQDLPRDRLQKEVEAAQDRDPEDMPDPLNVAEEPVNTAVERVTKGTTEEGYTIADTGEPSNLTRGTGGAAEEQESKK
jgi:hypothetical protein